MDLDKILLRFFTVVAKGKKHKHYAHTVAKNKEYRALVVGTGLDDKLRNYIRREDEDLFEQRVKLTNHVVTATVKNLMDSFYKVPRSSSARRVLTYKGKGDDKKLKEVEGILSKFWGIESWDDYMATRFVELNSIDPNSFVVFEFANFDAEKELVAPYPYEVSSSMAVDYGKENRVLEYLIAKDVHMYATKSADNPEVSGDNQSTIPQDEASKKGVKYTLYTKDQTFQLLQVADNYLTALTNLTEGRPKKLGADGFTFVKLGEHYFQYIVYKEHKTGRVPAVQVGYFRDLETEGHTYVSPIHPAIPYLEKSITTNSHLDLVATLLAFPQLIKYSEPCPADDCYDGVIQATQATCGTCGGTGKRATAPSAQDAIILKLPASKEEMIPLDQIAKYIGPDVSIVKWQEEYVEKLTREAKRIMFDSDSFDRKQVAETATGKALDMQNVYDTLHPFALKFGKVWTAGTEIMAKLADRDDDLVVSYTFGKDFKLKTLDTLIMDLSMANGIGNPTLVAHLNHDIAQNIFSEQPLELIRYQLKEMFNPFSGKSEKEILVLLGGELVSRRDKVLHANYGRIFDELEIEHVKASKDFYKLKRLAQREAIYKKVDEIIASLDAENPAPNLEL